MSGHGVRINLFVTEVIARESKRDISDLANIRRCNILTLHPLANDFGVILYGVCIAIAICYAQIYVGVHYPIDIVCGAILGFSIGYFISLRYNKHFGLS